MTAASACGRRRARPLWTKRIRVNYRPHALARNLRTQRTGALGILLPDLTNPVYAATVRGAMRQAEQAGLRYVGRGSCR